MSFRSFRGICYCCQSAEREKKQLLDNLLLNRNAEVPGKNKNEYRKMQAAGHRLR
jgi:hypothetical protein